MFADDLVQRKPRYKVIEQSYQNTKTSGKKNRDLVTVRNRRGKPPAVREPGRVKGERGSKVDWSIDKIENARSLPLLMNERLVNIVTAGGS